VALDESAARLARGGATGGTLAHGDAGSEFPHWRSRKGSHEAAGPYIHGSAIEFPAVGLKNPTVWL
jgi:hypothetical protein